MAFFELGERKKPRELMQAVEAEAAALKTLIDGRERTIEETKEMVSETKAAEEKLAVNLREVYQHLVQKVRATEASGVDEFCSYVDAQVELIEARQKKPSAPK